MLRQQEQPIAVRCEAHEQPILEYNTLLGVSFDTLWWDIYRSGQFYLHTYL